MTVTGGAIAQRAPAAGLGSVVLRASISLSMSPSMTLGQVVQVEPDAMVGQPVLGEVVGPDLLGSLARADHAPSQRRLDLGGLGPLAIEEPAAQDGHRLGLVLDLALLVLDGDDDAAGHVGDADGRVGRVDRLPAVTGGAVDVDPMSFSSIWTSTSSASGMTATVAVEVWIRPLDSVTGMRWTRCTPASNLRRLKRPAA